MEHVGSFKEKVAIEEKKKKVALAWWRFSRNLARLNNCVLAFLMTFSGSNIPLVVFWVSQFLMSLSVFLFICLCFSSFPAPLFANIFAWSTFFFPADMISRHAILSRPAESVSPRCSGFSLSTREREEVGWLLSEMVTWSRRSTVTALASTGTPPSNALLCLPYKPLCYQLGISEGFSSLRLP